MDPLTFRSRLEGGRLLRTLGGLCLAAAGSLSGADLTLTVEPRWRQEALAVPSGPVTNDTGQVLHVTRFAALLSEVSLVRVNGDTVRLEGQFGSLDAAGGRLAFTLRGVPDGEYAGLEFRIGLAPDVNHGDPGRWPARHALNPLVNGLHWNWQGGYVFAALEGTWLDGATHRGFLYHLATDERIMAVRFQARYEVRGDTGVALALNLARVLAAHPLKPGDAGESTHSAPDDLLAPELAAALERAWFWLSSGPSALSRSASAPPGAPAVPASPEVTPYAFVVPAGFPQPALPVDNALTHEGIALGAALFNDARLSGPGNQSCASCHDAARAFSDAVAISLGADGRPGSRNAMPLFNLAWSPAYGWDGRQPRLRDQALAAWVHVDEMHGEPVASVAVLSRDVTVRHQVAAAFGTPELTVERAILALEQFLLSLVAADSTFDRAVDGRATLTAEEQRGFELFALESDPARGRRGGDCFHCHGGRLFTDSAWRNNGLDPVASDPGRAGVTGVSSDLGRFKTPSLRNVALTAPYGHDGRFATLEEVVAHYDHGVRRTATLDPNLAKHLDAGLGLSAEDQRALVAFLRTLTELPPVTSPAPAGAAPST